MIFLYMYNKHASLTAKISTQRKKKFYRIHFWFKKNFKLYFRAPKIFRISWNQNITIVIPCTEESFYNIVDSLFSWESNNDISFFILFAVPVVLKTFIAPKTLKVPPLVISFSLSLKSSVLSETIKK